MKKKNLFLKYFNIRFFRHFIFLSLAKSKKLANILNLNKYYILVDEISAQKIIEYSEDYKLNLSIKEADFFKLPNEISFTKKIFLANDIIFNGHCGTSVDRDGNVISNNLSGTPVFRNQFYPKILKSKISANDTLYVNCLGFRKGHKQIYHFYEELVCLIAAIYYHAEEIAKFTNLRKIKIIVREDINNFQKLIFSQVPKNIANFSVEFETIKTNEKLYCKNILHIAKTSSYYRNYIDNETIKFANEIFKDQLDNLPIKNYAKKIYISRNDAKLRKLKNQNKLLKKISDFKLISAAKLTAIEQIKTFKAASNIIGIHGAGLTNLIYTQSEAKLLEIFPANYNDGAYIMLCKIKGIKYNFLIGTKGDMHQHFRVNAEDVKQNCNLY